MNLGGYNVNCKLNMLYLFPKSINLKYLKLIRHAVLLNMLGLNADQSQKNKNKIYNSKL